MNPRNDDGYFEVLRILVFVQLVIVTVTAVEAMFVGLVTGAGGSGVATLAAAVFTAVLYMGIGRRSPRSRRWLVRVQFGWIGLALLDLALAIFLAQRGLELVPLLTRIILPVAIWRIARREDVQLEFWPAPDAGCRIDEEAEHAMA